MVNHAKSGVGVKNTIYGENMEVMGLMHGKIIGATFYVLDAFALPVEGTETTVSVGNQALEFIGKHLDLSEKISRFENCVGWYHSHPGYSPHLSGTDVKTQS
jgi:COP9 signalosome complex subunit 5